MEIKISLHPVGVPETGETSMDSTYYSIHHNSGTPSGCDSFFPLTYQAKEK
jgi:hypothetical protein